MIQEVDFVVAGGGAAGCALAGRLSEDSRKSVLLLEAGPPSNVLLVKVPAGMQQVIASPERNWFFQLEQDDTAAGRAPIWFAGKTLGGGTAINGMVYIRGTPYDYDGWAAAGCTGWAWDDVLPYFLRSEDFDGPASPFHGKGGPLSVSRLRIVHPLAHAFVRACNEVGMKTIEEYCSGDIDGVYYNYATQRNGQRCSSARAFVEPALHRSNLSVLTGATVDRVLFEGSRVSGVRFRHEGAEREVRVRGEVIVSAGTLQSPAILQRSGIGPGAHLQSMGVEVLVDSGEVGKNLHEHPSMPISRLVDQPTLNVRSNPLRMGLEGLKYLFGRRGWPSTAAVHVQAHGRTSPELEHPDIKLQWLPFWADATTRPAFPDTSVLPDANKNWGVTVTVNLMTPKSRGEVRLRSTDPMDKPVIDYPMYGDPSDLERMRLALQFTNRIFEAPSMAKHVVGTAYPPDPAQSDEAWEEQIRLCSSVGYHPVATCRMGGDDGLGGRSAAARARRHRAARGRRLHHARAALRQHHGPRDHDRRARRRLREGGPRLSGGSRPCPASPPGTAASWSTACAARGHCSPSPRAGARPASRWRHWQRPSPRAPACSPGTGATPAPATSTSAASSPSRSSGPRTWPT